MLESWESLVPGRSPNAECFLRRWNIDNRMVTIFYPKKGSSQVVGYLALMPLTDQAVKRIFSGCYEQPKDMICVGDNMALDIEGTRGFFLSYVFG